jgi:hypothetical protein
MTKRIYFVQTNHGKYGPFNRRTTTRVAKELMVEGRVWSQIIAYVLESQSPKVYAKGANP